VRLLSLSYRVVSKDPERYRLAEDASATYRLGDFVCMLNKEWLRVEPTQDFPDQSSARVILDPLLQSWSAANEVGSDAAFEFSYHGCDFEREDGTRSLEVSLTLSYAIGVAPMREPEPVIRTFAALPEPPSAFASTEALDIIRERLRAMRRGRAYMPNAYWALTVIETEYGGGGKGARGRVPSCLPVDWKVLDTLGRLSSGRNHPFHGRKHFPDAPLLRDDEAKWLLATVERLARVVGEQEGGATPTTVTLDSLPPLDPSTARP
jgi:hypothetical protein